MAAGAKQKLRQIAEAEGRCVYGIHKNRGRWVGYQDRPAGKFEVYLGRNLFSATEEIRRLSQPVILHVLLKEKGVEECGYDVLRRTFDPFDGKASDWFLVRGIQTIEDALIWARSERVSFFNKDEIRAWIREGRD